MAFLPHETCPLIDAVLNAITNNKHIHGLVDEEYRAPNNYRGNSPTTVEEALEEIRESNELLRMAAVEGEEAIGGLEDATSKVEDLEQEIEDFRKQVADFERELGEMESVVG